MTLTGKWPFVLLIICFYSSLAPTTNSQQSKPRRQEKAWNPKISKAALAAGIRALKAVEKYELHIDPSSNSKASITHYEDEADQAITEVKIAAETEADKALNRALSNLEINAKTRALTLQLDALAAKEKSFETRASESQWHNCDAEIQTVLNSRVFTRKDAEASQCGTLVSDGKPILD